MVKILFLERVLEGRGVSSGDVVSVTALAIRRPLAPGHRDSTVADRQRPPGKMNQHTPALRAPLSRGDLRHLGIESSERGGATRRGVLLLLILLLGRLTALLRPNCAHHLEILLQFHCAPCKTVTNSSGRMPFDPKAGHGPRPGVQPIFRFSVLVEPGNYRVTVKLGSATAESTTTVKAESRRLMLERVRTAAAGEFASRTFIVNVRTLPCRRATASSSTPGNGTRQTNEAVTATWDGKLTLQFSGTRPAVAAMEIEKIEDATTAS